MEVSNIPPSHIIRDPESRQVLKTRARIAQDVLGVDFTPEQIQAAIDQIHLIQHRKATPFDRESVNNQIIQDPQDPQARKVAKEIAKQLKSGPLGDSQAAQSLKGRAKKTQ